MSTAHAPELDAGEPASSSVGEGLPWPELRPDLDRLDALLAAALRRRVAEAESGEGATPLLASLRCGHGAPGPAPMTPSAWRDPQVPGESTPLSRAARRFGLSGYEKDLLLLAVSVELGSHYARIVSLLNGDPRWPRPTVGLLLDVLPLRGADASRAMTSLLPEQPLRRLGHTVVADD